MRRPALRSLALDAVTIGSWAAMGWVLHDALGAVVCALAAVLSTHGIRTGYVRWYLWRGQKTPQELIAVAVLVLGYALAGGYLSPPETAQASAKVVRVIDGDTIEVDAIEGKIRLAGVDAPELSQPWGRQAKACLEDLAEGRWVVTKMEGRDLYGRTLAVLYLPAEEPVDLNRLLVLRGCAWAYDARYAAEEAQARQARRGLWAQEKPIRPSIWRKMRR